MPDIAAAQLDLGAAVIDLGRLAMAFGRIDRTACYHPDGGPRESDSDHTVMLGWIAPALAHRLWLQGFAEDRSARPASTP